MCGGGGGFLGSALSVVGLVTGQPELMAIGGGLNVASGIANGNPLQVIGGGLGVYGGLDAGAFGGDAIDQAFSQGAGATAANEAFAGTSAPIDWNSISGGLTDTGSFTGDSWNALTGAGDFSSQGLANLSQPAQDFLQNTQDFTQGLGQTGNSLGSATSASINGFTPTLDSSTTALNPTSDFNTYGDTPLNTDINSSSFEGNGISGAPQSQIGQTDYSYQNKDFFGNTTGSGFSGNPTTDNPLYNTKLANAGDSSFTQPVSSTGSKMLSNLFTNRDSLPVAGLKALGGIDSYLQNRKALQTVQGMADPFAVNRAVASPAWNNVVQNPESMWDTFIGGQGKTMMQNAAAQYAAAGRRNMMPQLLAQAHQNYLSNYLPSYMKSVNPNQFAPTGGATQAIAGLTQNQNAPLFNAATSVISNKNVQDGVSNLYDSLFNS